MSAENLLGERYTRAGPEVEGDIWQVIDVKNGDEGWLVTLRSLDGERATISAGHLRAPYWRRLDDPTAAEVEES
jgi:SH3-like domain-containing protein